MEKLAISEDFILGVDGIVCVALICTNLSLSLFL